MDKFMAILLFLACSLVFSVTRSVAQESDDLTEEQTMEELRKVADEMLAEWRASIPLGDPDPFGDAQKAWIQSLPELPSGELPGPEGLPGPGGTGQQGEGGHPGTGAPGPAIRPVSRALRREYRTLSDTERRRFHDALNKLKRTDVNGTSEYDLLVKCHQGSVSPAAHFGAAFLPWHREYLTRLEDALRNVDPSVSLPYWDSSLDHQLEDPKDSIMWTEEFLGNGYGDVDTGPFASWTVTGERWSGCHAGKIMRMLSSSKLFLLKDNEIHDYITRSHMNLTAYEEYQSMTQLETIHFGPHNFISGYMATINCAPNDPAFFLHHCFIDYLWELYRETQQSSLTHYLPCNGNCFRNLGGREHAGDAPMKPFTDPSGELMKNEEGLSLHYTQDLYTYADRPFKCNKDQDCGAFLFCHQGRCKSKVKSGGNCKGLGSGTAPCQTGSCISDRCQDI